MTRSEYTANSHLAQHATLMARLQPTAGELQRAAMRRQQSFIARMVRAIFN